MIAGISCARKAFRRGALPVAVRASAIAGLALGIAAPGPALAYVGPSFLSVPGVAGGWQGATYKGWLRLEANYWGKPPPTPPIYQGKSRNFFSGPLAPRSGRGQLVVSLDKRNPALAKLMKACADGEKLPELTYAESSERARPPAELGPRPADIPEYFEYRLKDVTIGCPVAPGAPEQGLVLSFGDIQWLNFKGEGHALVGEPAKLPRAQLGGRSKAYIVKWFWSANAVSADQCPVMSSGPTESEYYAYKSPDVVAREKAENAPKGGILASFITGKVAYRGPGGLNASLLPGIVPDPGQPSPQTKAVWGLNLDGDDGTHPPAWTRAHRNYVSPDGLQGVDNQYFSVDGCIKGFSPKGILTVTTHEGRRNGEISMMILVSGIDDDRNDDRVDVTLLYSDDPMVKSADGKDILPGYTFRVSTDPQRTPYFKRMHGHIVDGVVITDPVDSLAADKGRDMMRLYDARMRLEMKADGTLRGLVAGYQDWRNVANYWGSLTIFENGMGYRSAGVYNALKRAADGLKDPVTGEFNGISTAYEIEGVFAYLPPEQQVALLGGDAKRATVAAK